MSGLVLYMQAQRLFDIHRHQLLTLTLVSKLLMQ